MAVLLSRCSVLQSKQGTAVWCWQNHQREEAEKLFRGYPCLSKAPSILPIGNYLTAVFANLCTMGMLKVGADKRKGWEKSDLVRLLLQVSTKYPWATRKGQLSSQPTQTSIKGFSNLLHQSQITIKNYPCKYHGLGAHSQRLRRNLKHIYTMQRHS